MYEKSLSLDPTCEEALRGLGAIYLNRGEYGKSIEYLQRYADNFPESTLAKELLNMAYSQSRKIKAPVLP
jgi:tetratricopeptide (TPR) repeat protein